MNLEQKLSRRIHINDIHEMVMYVQGDNHRKEELFRLLFHTDDKLAYQAVWVFTHFREDEDRWLHDRQDTLIDEVLRCAHSGKRRLLLNLLYKQSFPNPPRVDFLDFCLDRMLAKEELPGVQTLCMKIAYELCRPIPELLRELRTTLEMMETDLLPVSIRTARRNLLKRSFTRS